MIKSYCDACGEGKENITAQYCNRCASVRSEAMQGFAAEHPDASQSDILYVGRQALNQVRMHAHRNFVDPRDFSGTQGMIPIPPARDLGGA